MDTVENFYLDSCPVELKEKFDRFTGTLTSVIDDPVRCEEELGNVVNQLCGNDFEGKLLDETTYMHWDVYCSALFLYLKGKCSKESFVKTSEKIIENAEKTKQHLQEEENPDRLFIGYVEQSIESWEWVLSSFED